jgi:hypothetical protein
MFAVGASPGTGPLTFSYTGLPSGCISSNTSNLLCTPSASGDYTLVVTVLDEAGARVSSSAKMTVNPAPKIAAFTSSLYALDVGQNILLTVSASGGTGQLSYVYSGLSLVCASSNAASLPCTLDKSGTYTVTVIVSDSIGGSTSSTLTIKVAAYPIASFTASNLTIDLGQGLALNTHVDGGTEPLSYSYSGLPPGCVSANSASLSCAPSATGSYLVQVTVNDQFGKTSTSSLSVTVYPRTLFGLPLLVGYSLVAGIAVAALGLSISILRSRKTRTQ